MVASKVFVPHLKVQFGGSIGNPALEVWSNTVRFTNRPRFDAEGPPEGILDDIVEAVAGPIQTWFASPEANIRAGSCKLEYVKANWIMANGKQRDTNTHLYDLPADVFGGGGGQTSPPWHLTTAITMRTALRRGRGHAGRIFPPCISAFPEGTTPYINKLVADGMAGKWAEALTNMAGAMQEAIGGEIANIFYPAVLAAGETADGPNGFGLIPLDEVITSVVVDRVPDVQHRRTNRVPRLEANTVPVNI